MDDLVLALTLYLGAGAAIGFIAVLDAIAEHPPAPLARIWNAIAHPRRRKEHHRG